MKSPEYWRKRFVLLERAQHVQCEVYTRQMEQQFRAATRKVQADIESWYMRFADNNDIDLAEAKRLLNSSELEELKWSVQDYIKHGQEYGISGAWERELENASTRAHISRLESLQIQINHQIEMLYGGRTDEVDALLHDLYRERYAHTAFEVQRAFRVGFRLDGVENDKIAGIIRKPWTDDGLTFSARIWSHQKELKSTLRTGLVQALIRGDSPQAVTDMVAKRFRVAKNQAARLVMTESAFFASAAQKDCYKELDVKEYQIVATLDDATSEICQSLDLKVYRMADYEPGVTAPPFHPWCRTVTAPYIKDNYGERAARGRDGKVYYIPANIDYPTWKKRFAA